MDFNKFEIALTFVVCILIYPRKYLWRVSKSGKDKNKICYIFRQPTKVRIFHSYLGTLASITISV